MEAQEKQDSETIVATARQRYMDALLEAGKRATIESMLNYEDAQKLREAMDMDPKAVDDLDFAYLLDTIVERHEEPFERLFREWEERNAQWWAKSHFQSGRVDDIVHRASLELNEALMSCVRKTQDSDSKDE